MRRRSRKPSSFNGKPSSASHRVRLRLAVKRAIVLVAVFFGGSSVALAAEISSGLAIGARPSPFNVKDCTGPAAGKTLCYYCRYESRPVVGVFVHELNDSVAELIRGIDRAVGNHRGDRLAAFVVYLGKDTAEIEQEIKNLAEKQRLRFTPLTIFKDNRAKLTEELHLAEAAALTILVWRDGVVQARRGFDAAVIDERERAAVLSDMEQILGDNGEIGR